MDKGKDDVTARTLKMTMTTPWATTNSLDDDNAADSNHHHPTPATMSTSTIPVVMMSSDYLSYLYSIMYFLILEWSLLHFYFVSDNGGDKVLGPEGSEHINVTDLHDIAEL